MNYIVLHSTIYGSSEKVALLIMFERFFHPMPLAPLQCTVGLKKPKTVKKFVPIVNNVQFFQKTKLSWLAIKNFNFPLFCIGLY